MHLHFERNIQIPGSFVVCQGISGDGLLNTIDSAPDFDTVPSTLETTDHQRTTHPTSSESEAPPRAFLGQGILAPPRTLISSQFPSSQATLNSARENHNTFQELPCISGEPFEHIEQQIPPSSSNLPDTHSSISPTVNDEIKRSIRFWREECAVMKTREAEEWFQNALEQQRFNPSNLNATIPIISKCQQRWWIDPGTAMLRVFRDLPTPLPRNEQDCALVFPGTTLVATALYTFDLKQSPNIQNLHDQNAWIAVGSCKNCSDSQRLPLQHHPRTARIQYLQLESPFKGFVLFTVDGNNLAMPGFPSSPIVSGYSESSDGGMDKMGRPCWWWKVVSHVGAVVRQGQDLSSRQIGLLPFGTTLQVMKKVVNAAGLRRVLIMAHTHETGRIQGWCSEFLNPLSGQRGPILQPIPLAVPAMYRVRQPCLVRKTAELSGAVLRELEPCSHTAVPVLSRVYTEFPTQNCLVRLRLAPGAYASLRMNTTSVPTSGLEEGGDERGQIILQPTGRIDGSFDPSDPGMYHWRVYQEWKHFLSPPETITESSEDDNSIEELSSFDGIACSAVDSQVPLEPQEPNLRKEKLCMCCEDNPTNATLVHGETGHICVCLECARVCKAQGLGCPICRLPIEQVILHYYA